MKSICLPRQSPLCQVCCQEILVHTALTSSSGLTTGYSSVLWHFRLSKQLCDTGAKFVPENQKGKFDCTFSIPLHIISSGSVMFLLSLKTNHKMRQDKMYILLLSLLFKHFFNKLNKVFTYNVSAILKLSK